jgi:hypothetical protein
MRNSIFLTNNGEKRYNTLKLRKDETMKKTILYILFVCLFICPTYATYYEITTNIYTPGLTLQTGDSLYMTNGGFDSLTLRGYSTAIIEGTAALEEGAGGIWYLGIADNSHLEMSGGQVNQLTMNNNATARLTGGLIQQIWSYQYTGTFGPHITLVYSGELSTIQTIYGLPHLVGQWGNGDPFAIYLSEVPANNYGYDPAITNIRFELIPEPASLALLALGSLLIRKRGNLN